MRKLMTESGEWKKCFYASKSPQYIDEPLAFKVAETTESNLLEIMEVNPKFPFDLNEIKRKVKNKTWKDERSRIMKSTIFGFLIVLVIKAAIMVFLDNLLRNTFNIGTGNEVMKQLRDKY